MTEVVERYGNIIPFIKPFDYFIGFLLSFKLLTDQEFLKFSNVQFGHEEFIVIGKLLIVIFLENLLELFPTVEYFP